MTDSPDLIADVFRTVGQPTITYVQRASGVLEKDLRNALNERGQLCLVTGPSKTGKTTLYREVLQKRGEEPLIVQCDREKTCKSIWRSALEAVNFERVQTRNHGKSVTGSAEIEASGKLGWKWLASITGRVKGGVAGTASEGEVRERILADPGPDLLIPILKNTNYVLVIEDFHYLDEVEKITLFQQWKRFVDNEVSVLVLGTTHRAVDIANSNRDLVGRITQIDVGHWGLPDLEKICEKGFAYLKAKITPEQIRLIANEAVGLPIVVQQTCLNIFTSKGFESVDQAKKSKFKTEEHSVDSSLHNVARQRYTQFESYYNTLISGPREKARKYRTYELVLACFTLDPIKFSLKRSEIDHRLSRLKLKSKEMPPAASLNSTLGALKKFQEKRGFDLLEWRPSEDILYIIEPAFLFYVRWRRLKQPQMMQLDLFEELMVSIRITGANDG